LGCDCVGVSIHVLKTKIAKSGKRKKKIQKHG
jgi:hypothetical protein